MATALNDLVACIQATESSPTELKKLLSHLQAQEEVLIQHMPQLDDASQALTPHLHTLGLVYILNVKGSAVPLSNAAAVTMFIAQCRRLLLGCDPAQAQMVPAQFVAVCTKFSAACLAGGGSPLTAVRPLQAAALALQPTMTHFTPLHAECLRVCLLAKTYSAARPLLEQELLHVDREATLVTPRDLLLFHYYAGMVRAPPPPPPPLVHCRRRLSLCPSHFASIARPPPTRPPPPSPAIDPPRLSASHRCTPGRSSTSRP